MSHLPVTPPRESSLLASASVEKKACERYSFEKSEFSFLYSQEPQGCDALSL
jgi:hypothetical protein